MRSIPADPTQRKRVLLGVLPLLLAFGYAQLVLRERTDSVRRLEARLARLEAGNDQARSVGRTQVDELERRVTAYQDHMARLERLLPRQHELPELLDAIARRASESGVDLLRLAPEELVAQPVADDRIPEEHYARQTFYLHVAGGYHDLGRFLAAVGSLDRIAVPQDLVLGPASGEAQRVGGNNGARRLEAELRVEMYLLAQPSTREEG